MGFFFWGEENDPAYKGSTVQSIDPEKVTRRQRHTLDEKAVGKYVADAGRKSDDGDVCVREIGNGEYEYFGNGAHRLEAARRAGRLVRARVYPRGHSS